MGEETNLAHTFWQDGRSGSQQKTFWGRSVAMSLFLSSRWPRCWLSSWLFAKQGPCLQSELGWCLQSDSICQQNGEAASHCRLPVSQCRLYNPSSHYRLLWRHCRLFFVCLCKLHISEAFSGSSFTAGKQSFTRCTGCLVDLVFYCITGLSYALTLSLQDFVANTISKPCCKDVSVHRENHCMQRDTFICCMCVFWIEPSPWTRLAWRRER